MKTRHEGKLVEYLTATCVHEPSWMADARAEGEKRRPGMQLSPYEGSLLRWLVSISGTKRVLEIGTFMGYSALWMASAGAEVVTLEFDANYAAQARSNIAASPHASRITVLEGDAIAWLGAQNKKPQFDLLFLDAEKRSYMHYLELATPLLNPHAWVIGDNTFLWGAVTGEEPDAAKPEAVKVMKQFNATLSDPTHYEGIILPTAEGFTIGRRKA